MTAEAADKPAVPTAPAPAKAAPATAEAATEPLTAEVGGSAEAYRKVGEVFVSVLAAIPTATLVTSLIRAPGDAGLDEWRLAAGLFLAALALAIGVQLVLWLRMPVEISSKALEDFNMSRIIETRQEDYKELRERIEELEDAVADAVGARQKSLERQYQAVLATLRTVHLLATADALRARVTKPTTKLLAAAALAAAATAVFFLATAPKAKPEKAPAGPTVVSVKLSAVGMSTLGCPETFNALKLGGSDTEPQVVPLGIKCAAPYVTLKVSKKKGSALEVKAVEP